MILIHGNYLVKRVFRLHDLACLISQGVWYAIVAERVKLGRGRWLSTYQVAGHQCADMGIWSAN